MVENIKMREETEIKIDPKQIEEYERKLAIYEEKIKSGWEKFSYNEFLDLVVERLDPKLNYKKPICPYCNSHKVTKGDHVTTLVGWVDGPNPNHQCVKCTCKKCKKIWTMEYKGDYEFGYNVWYTTGDRIKGKIIRGLPTCFENYIYTCKYCGGDVCRYNYEKRTRNEAKCLSWDGEGNKSFDTYYRCNKCGREVKCSNEYYSYRNPHRPSKPHDPRKPIGWTIKERIGTVIVNDRAIKDINF